MDQQTRSRIDSVINNLRAATSFRDKYSPPQPLADRMKFYHTPGVSIAVINNFRIEWAKGFGLSDSRRREPVTSDTLFQAGSISKPIFALAVMRLAQEGKVDLDEDINHYLTSWQLPANDGWQPRVTLRQILSHSAGLTIHGFPGYQSTEKLPAVTQILNGEPPANTAKVEVNILPGIQFRYSGGGTTAAQQLLVDLLKRPFPQIMHDLVLDPLGLTNSTFAQPLPRSWAKRAATAHPWKGIPLRGRFHTYPEMAAAGLWTTAADLARVGVELLQVLHDRTLPVLLTKETIDAMLRPQLPHQKAGEGDYVGLGFACSGKEAGFHFGHGGWDEGFVAQMRIYRNIGKGAIAMINSNQGHPLLDEIMRAIGEVYEWPNALPPAKTAVYLADVEKYSGLYMSKTGVQFRVLVADGRLLLQHGQQLPLPLFPASATEFFAQAIDADVFFELSDQGEPVSLRLSQAGNEVVAGRQAPS